MNLLASTLLITSPTDAVPAGNAQACSDQSGWELVQMGELPPESRFRGPARITIDYDIDAAGRVSRADIAHQYGRADTLEMMATRFGQSVFAATSETAGPVINCRVRLSFDDRGEGDAGTGISDASQARARDQDRHDTWHRPDGRFARNSRARDRD